MTRLGPRTLLVVVCCSIGVSFPIIEGSAAASASTNDSLSHTFAVGSAVDAIVSNQGFWQLLTSTSSGRWTLATPPGVASTGGIAAATLPGVQGIMAGFIPSQGLKFSPLATSADNGAVWSAQLLPGGLASTAYSLAQTEAGEWALISNAGGEILASKDGGATWKTVLNRSSITTVTGKACQRSSIAALTSFDSAGVAVLSCADGDIAAVTKGSTSVVSSLGSPSLGGELTRSTLSVVGVAPETTGIEVTAVATKGSTSFLVACGYDASSKEWTKPVAVTLPSGLGDAGVSVNVTGASIAAVVGTGHSQRILTLAPHATHWKGHGATPSPSATSYFDAAGHLLALSSRAAVFHTFVLRGTHWHLLATLKVPNVNG